ncbi:MAG: threonylcarbamoyl-AMP synthase [Leptospiraceae bacterium]|nr:threonylcarbamoyl-AMP synthase [Leptospiraceae bacterium]
MIVNLHPVNPEIRTLKLISDTLKEGGVYIFPTDTAYALIADSQSRVGVEKIYRLKDINKNKPLSVLCPDISTAADYIENLPNIAFKLMKRITPGPFTFILRANKNLPRVTLSNSKNKHVGIRIPDNVFIQELLKVHKGTLTSTSIFTNDEYVTDIDDLEKAYGERVEGIIDGGNVDTIPSTIIDFTGGEMEIIREGKGMELLEFD